MSKTDWKWELSRVVGSGVYDLLLLQPSCSTNSHASTECSFSPTQKSRNHNQVLTARAGEDDGFLLTYVYDEASDRSELVVYNAKSMSAAPVARVKLPCRVRPCARLRTYNILL